MQGVNNINGLKMISKKAVQNRAVRPWIVLVGHRPMYCSNTYVSCQDTGLRNNLEHLIHSYNVDVALWGHVHAYERSLPVYNLTVAGTYDNPKGTVHVLAGMAGAVCCGEWWNDPQPSWSGFRYSDDFGFTRFHVFNGTTLHWEFIRNWDGEVYDDFWLTSDHQFN